MQKDETSRNEPPAARPRKAPAKVDESHADGEAGPTLVKFLPTVDRAVPRALDGVVRFGKMCNRHQVLAAEMTPHWARLFDTLGMSIRHTVREHSTYWA